MSDIAKQIWKRACEGREGYCSSDLQDAARQAIDDAIRIAIDAAAKACLPDRYQWSDGNVEKFNFGRDRAVQNMMRLLDSDIPDTD